MVVFSERVATLEGEGKRAEVWLTAGRTGCKHTKPGVTLHASWRAP